MRNYRRCGGSLSALEEARLSSLGFEHVNMLGWYAFTPPDVVACGELRPLRDPALHDYPRSV